MIGTSYLVQSVTGIICRDSDLTVSRGSRRPSSGCTIIKSHGPEEQFVILAGYDAELDTYNKETSQTKSILSI